MIIEMIVNFANFANFETDRLIAATLLCLDNAVVLMKNGVVNAEQLVLGLEWARWKRGWRLLVITE